MEPDELQEKTEHAMHTGQKAIGLTLAIVAVLLASVAQLSHRSHTEAILLLGRSVDQWNLYQAKHIRAHEYGLVAEVTALLPNGRAASIRELKKSTEEECGSLGEHGCNTPAKDSEVLQPYLKDIAGEGKSQKTGEAAGGKNDENAKPEKMPTDHGKEEAAKPAAAKEGAVKIQERAYELEAEQRHAEKRADLFDTGELFLQISVVLCSISLLAGAKLYWRLSFITTAIGVTVAIVGWFLR
ncbi:MAG TPA: DUF4337 family protein [Candidatus Angelobacter sp.]|nr:DUF4337 family protein [Candidatus Angelobacter sp.]